MSRTQDCQTLREVIEGRSGIDQESIRNRSGILIDQESIDIRNQCELPGKRSGIDQECDRSGIKSDQESIRNETGAFPHGICIAHSRAHSCTCLQPAAHVRVACICALLRLRPRCCRPCACACAPAHVACNFSHLFSIIKEIGDVGEIAEIAHKSVLSRVRQVTCIASLLRLIVGCEQQHHDVRHCVINPDLK